MGRGISYKFHDYFCTYINIRINIRFTFRIDKLWLPFVHVIRQCSIGILKLVEYMLCESCYRVPRYLLGLGRNMLLGGAACSN